MGITYEMENTTVIALDPHNPFKASTISIHQPLHYYLIPLLLVYLITVRILRHARLRSTKKAFPYPTRRSFASMTDEDAYRIQQIVAELEFPFTYEKALQFALFRTYGIPSISTLLVATSQLSNPATAPKRYVDTTVLIKEFMGHPPTSARTLEAIGRMNYLHRHYQRAGRISNDDMLYTLALFALEPIRWIDRYEWRQLEDVEKCAIGTFWKSMGDVMEISYDALLLQSGNDPKRKHNEFFIDGLHWLDELRQWAEGYEQRAMLPHANNHTTADQTTHLLLWNVPTALKPLGKSLVSALMDPLLRTAMIYPTPPAFLLTLTPTLLRTRAFLLRHFSLPRPARFAVHHPSRDPTSTSTSTSSPPNSGRYTLSHYDNAPFYVPPTLWRRWGPGSWAVRAMGLPLPGDEKEKYVPEGYLVSEVGPKRLGRGVLEVKRREGIGEGGVCPFG